MGPTTGNTKIQIVQCLHTDSKKEYNEGVSSKEDNVGERSYYTSISKRAGTETCAISIYQRLPPVTHLPLLAFVYELNRNGIEYPRTTIWGFSELAERGETELASKRDDAGERSYHTSRSKTADGEADEAQRET